MIVIMKVIMISSDINGEDCDNNDNNHDFTLIYLDVGPQVYLLICPSAAGLMSLCTGDGAIMLKMIMLRILLILSNDIVVVIVCFLEQVELERMTLIFLNCGFSTLCSVKVNVIEYFCHLNFLSQHLSQLS